MTPALRQAIFDAIIRAIDVHAPMAIESTRVHAIATDAAIRIGAIGPHADRGACPGCDGTLPAYCITCTRLLES